MKRGNKGVGLSVSIVVLSLMLSACAGKQRRNAASNCVLVQTGERSYQCVPRGYEATVKRYHAKRAPANAN